MEELPLRQPLDLKIIKVNLGIVISLLKFSVLFLHFVTMFHQHLTILLFSLSLPFVVIILLLIYSDLHFLSHQLQ